jgi:hypothetical protein
VMVGNRSLNKFIEGESAMTDLLAIIGYQPTWAGVRYAVSGNDLTTGRCMEQLQ